jgi:hypothetical protein
MEEYLREIEYAATETLRLVWREEKELEELLALIGRSEKEIAEANARMEFLAKNPELDDEGIGTAIHWDTYFGPEKERYYAEKGRPELETLVGVRKFSTNAQAANVLQYAKQAMSSTHGRKDACPQGKVVIGSVSLRDIAWEGRNQAQPWEEGDAKRGVQQCFDALAAADPRFAPYRTQNLAFEVVKLLGWRDYADFQRDMMTLA